MAATTVFNFDENDFKVRWREPYVSEALNRKVAGVIPRGIYRGFSLATDAAPLTVQLLADASGEHLAVYETLTDYSLTVRRTGGAITIDLSAFASQTVYIVMYAEYSTVVPTTAVIRVYPQADYIIAPEQPELVVFGKVVVPAGGVIPAINVDTTEATDVRYSAAFLQAIKTVELAGTNPEIPKILGDVTPSVGSYFLLQQFKFNNSPDAYVRIYASRQNIGEALYGLAFTINAFYDVGTALWASDDVTNPASQFVITYGASRFLTHSATAGTWTSDTWDETNGAVTGHAQMTIAPWIEQLFGAHNIETDPTDTKAAPFSVIDNVASYLDHYIPVLFTRNTRTSGTENGAGRVYVAGGSSPSSPSTFPGLVFTQNARWRPSVRRWVADDWNSPTSLHVFGIGALASIHINNPTVYNTGVPATEGWDDSQWEQEPTVGTIGGSHRISGQYEWAYPRLLIKEISLFELASGTMPGLQGQYMPLFTENDKPTSIEYTTLPCTGYWNIRLPQDSAFLNLELMVEFSGGPPVNSVSASVGTRGITIGGTDRDWTPPYVAGTQEVTPSVFTVATTTLQVLSIPVVVFIDNYTNEYFLKVVHFNAAVYSKIVGIRVLYLEAGLRGL